MRALKSVFVLLSLCTACSSADAPFERSGFDLKVCDAETSSAFLGISPGVPVDLLELQHGIGGSTATGTFCGGATDATACREAYDALELIRGQGWTDMVPGGAPLPESRIVFTRGDEVGAVYRSDLASFLAPIDAFDAAFLAEVATTGRLQCPEPAVRQVEGGFEVLTHVSYTCGGGKTEVLVRIDDEGSATVLERREVELGEDIICG